MTALERHVGHEQPASLDEAISIPAQFTMGLQVLRDTPMLLAVHEGREGLRPAREVLNIVGASISEVWANEPEVLSGVTDKKRAFRLFCAMASTAVDHGFHLGLDRPNAPIGIPTQVEMAESAHVF